MAEKFGPSRQIKHMEQIRNKSFPAARICATVNIPLTIGNAMTNEDGMDEETPRKAADDEIHPGREEEAHSGIF
ncbi:MAG TPA: hypothetical protein VFE63_16390 [Roseiarcus sp.]|nr:hypothetical protein [Roseiarcus sp.]